MANSLYATGRDAFLNGNIDFLSDNIKMALISNAYTPNLTLHQYWSDISSNVVGTPQLLSSKSTSGGVANCANVTFLAVAGGSTVSYLALYKDTGTPSTSPLIGLYDTATGIPIATSGADITIQIDTGSNKLFKL
jgi:hypothetical protein